MPRFARIAASPGDARNMRFDSAQRALDGGCEAVSAVAARFGFRSVTTFAVEYRNRFGRPPSYRRRGNK
jgi:transcriptional regulator GlxA family with amidase domain